MIARREILQNKPNGVELPPDQWFPAPVEAARKELPNEPIAARADDRVSTAVSDPSVRLRGAVPNEANAVSGSVKTDARRAAPNEPMLVSRMPPGGGAGSRTKRTQPGVSGWRL
jgi:hypothetical protein